MLIISASAPRAGSSWYYQMINALLLAAGHEDAEALRDKHRWLFARATPNMNIGTLYGSKLLRLVILSQVFGTFAVKTHAKPTRFLRTLTKYNLAKSIFIYREPRDRLVSIMNIAAKQRAIGITDRSFAHVSSFEDALKEVSTSYKHFEIWQKNPETMMIRFEDLLQNRNAEMQKTAKFLGLKLQAEQITAALEVYDSSMDKERSHFVHGKIAYYKEALSAEQIERATIVLAEDIKNLGYSID